MQYLLIAVLMIAGIIHLLPMVGVLGSAQLHSLYGAEIKDPNLLILMRHRAVLFALLGALLVYAAFKPSYQVIAILGGLVSTAAFFWLAFTAVEYNSNMTRVLYADIVAIISLLIAATIKWSGQSS